MKRTIVTLDITWDEDTTTNPSGWDWNMLIDVGFDEEATVVSFTDVEDE